jgi:2-desacetyl-2-hydroxyethyl bacteriochlorophyllide A dehydrogenase
MESMGQRIIFPKKGEVSFETFDERAPNADEVVVRALYSVMSIGTETTILHAKYGPDTHFAKRFSFPQLKTGVQTIGRIEAVGTEVREFSRGERVFIRFGHASHVTLPAAACSLVPETVDLKNACWCGLAKTAFRAAHAAPFTLGGRVLIIGAGPVGQMALRWAVAAGVADLAVIDVAPLRLTLARRGGAAACFEGRIDSLRETLLAHTEGLGFDVIVDTTGSPVVLPEALGAAAMFGRVILLGDTGYPERQHLTSDMMTKGLSIIATHDHQDRGGWTQRRIDSLFFKLVLAGRFSLDGLITHEFHPADCKAAYALASDQRDDALGILFDWTKI